MKRQAAALLMALGLLTALAGCGAREAEVSASPEPTPTVTAAPAPSASPEPLETPEPFDGTIFVSCEQSGLANTYEGYIVLKADALLPTVSIEGRDEAAKAITDALQGALEATEESTREAYKAPAKPSTPGRGRARDLARPRLEQQRDGHPGRRHCAQLLCRTYSYSGGAHGSYDYFGQTFSTVTGEAISLDELATDPAALREALTEAILADAGEDEEELFDIEGFTERVFDTDAWYLTDDALVIFAQVGEVAAGARGRSISPCL